MDNLSSPAKGKKQFVANLFFSGERDVCAFKTDKKLRRSSQSVEQETQKFYSSCSGVAAFFPFCSDASPDLPPQTKTCKRGKNSSVLITQQKKKERRIVGRLPRGDRACIVYARPQDEP